MAARLGKDDGGREKKEDCRTDGKAIEIYNTDRGGRNENNVSQYRETSRLPLLARTGEILYFFSLSRKMGTERHAAKEDLVRQSSKLLVERI